MAIEPSGPGVISDTKETLALLAASGVAGAYFRAVYAPESEWKRRAVQGLGGALSAIFLGGLLGHLILQIIDAGVYAYLAAGFIMGSGGEVVVKALQEKVTGKK